MRKFIKYAIIIALVPALFFTSCKKDDDDPDVRQTDAEFQMLADYMIEQDLDVPNLLDGWITTASVVYENMTDGDDTNDYFVIDIRAADAYAAGHIEGSVNATLGGILTAADGSNGKTIIVACYTGQGAGHAVTALRLSGYPAAKVLKWGMSGWNSTLSASWENSTGDAAIGHANWVAAPGALATVEEFDDLDLDPAATTGAEILAERVAAMLAGGFKGVVNGDVLDSPGNYFINNYWAATDVEHYGHIAGAYRVNPLTLAAEEYVNLDPSKTIVTYCWTGQTSSMMTAILTVLGYDAVSLKFGVNSMIYSDLESHKWAALAMDLPLVQ